MRFWGITGTNGKTTTALVFAEFVNAAVGRKCGYITTVEAFDGARHFYTGYTTPPNKVLMEILTGQAVPGGRLPLPMPASMETVEKHCEDVYDDLEVYVDSCGNRYDFGFGLGC